MDLDIRDLLAFPPGDNSSDTIIAGIHYNLTTLRHWNYTYYSNHTFSNGSLCFLLFEPYTPHLLQNGTFRNSTSCYSPIRPLGARSKIGLFFACFFALSIMFTFINLRKHGRLFLPLEKRFRAVGRRWQWYYMLMVAAFALISGITNVDVDRYYLPELPLVLSNFFWFLMLPATMCVVWESVRHWGSWQERQVIDHDPFMIREAGTRYTVELCMPLVFYLFVWMNIAMLVPRSWGKIEFQRDPEQARLRAAPVATDVRFRLAALFLFFAWLTTVFCLWHSIKHFKPKSGALKMIKYTPPKFYLTLLLSLTMIGYEAVCAFDFSISPLNIYGNLGMIYGLGWGTIAMIFVVYEIAGYIDPNEDKELIRQRRLRSAEADRELGIAKKPTWWSLLNNNHHASVQDQIRNNVNEVEGKQLSTRNLQRGIEMGNMPGSKTQQSANPFRDSETARTAPGLLFPTYTMEETQGRFTGPPGPSMGRSGASQNLLFDDLAKHGSSTRTGSTSTAVTLGASTQQIRSMLDV